MAKKAFLTGINAYEQSPLRGCVNDVSAMYDLLTQAYGFPPDDVRVLADQRATTQAMRERLDWLVTGLSPDDVVVLHYSGHGSQVRDRGPQDELADHMDEILCPVDLDWHEKLISDDDLASYLNRIPRGVRCYVVLDCCHSGTGTRDLRPSEEDGGNPHPESYRKSRFLAPPFDIEARSLGRESLVRQTMGRGAAPRGTMLRTVLPKPAGGFWAWVWRLLQKKVPPAVKVTAVPTMGHVLVSGCRSDQTSADAYIGGKYTGALTFHLTKAIRENPGKPLAEVHSIAKSAILAGGYSQESQLEGPQELLSRPIFT